MKSNAVIAEQLHSFEQSKKSAAVGVDGSYLFNIGRLKQNYLEEHLERMEILQRAA